MSPLRIEAAYERLSADPGERFADGVPLSERHGSAADRRSAQSVRWGFRAVWESASDVEPDAGPTSHGGAEPIKSRSGASGRTHVSRGARRLPATEFPALRYTRQGRTLPLLVPGFDPGSGGQYLDARA